MSIQKPIFKLFYENKIKKAYIDVTSYPAFVNSIAQSLHITDIHNYDIQYTDQEKDPISITDQAGLNIALQSTKKDNPPKLTVIRLPTSSLSNPPSFTSFLSTDENKQKN